MVALGTEAIYVARDATYADSGPVQQVVAFSDEQPSVPPL